LSQKIFNSTKLLQVEKSDYFGNNLSNLKGKTEQETYAKAKRTLAIVTAPPSNFKLSPIPPSADWQFHLAQGCPPNQ
jgi:spore photoproduct lyase